mmetsp:Transcript_25272/g.63229  ORF Transcript_25272/g.63229 Transcript_25272/m.63229 type:complete len:248 (-) Transcript_25272:46-789(-)
MDEEHVTIWNRSERRKVAGNAAPLRRNLARYLMRHPDCEVYFNQDLAAGVRRRRIAKMRRGMWQPAGNSPNERVVLWNLRTKATVRGEDAPEVKNLSAFLCANMDFEIYSGQDFTEQDGEEEADTKAEDEEEPARSDEDEEDAESGDGDEGFQIPECTACNCGTEPGDDQLTLPHFIFDPSISVSAQYLPDDHHEPLMVTEEIDMLMELSEEADLLQEIGGFGGVDDVDVSLDEFPGIGASELHIEI